MSKIESNSNISQDVIANASEIYAGLQVENGKPYRPSNGTEGDIFMTRWCQRCTKDSESLGIYCPIVTSALCGDKPKEWIYYDNKPMCTAFNKREI